MKRAGVRQAIGRQPMVFLLMLAALAVAVLAQSGGKITDPVEKSALLAFRRALIDHENVLGNWVSSSDPCGFPWQGVFCAATNQPNNSIYLHVTELRLLNYYLGGTLVPDLGNLSSLVTLDVMWNLLTGEIPSTLGQLSNLLILALNGNNLTGIIPPELGNLTKMNRIQLDENQISGQIPDSFAGLTSVQHMHLNNNSLNGSIPPGLGQLPHVIHILLDNNQLTGSMPPEIGNATTLVILQLDNNQLGGVVPTNYTNLASLTKLSCRNCGLIGTIPDLSNLRNLSFLDLSHNSLTGSFPNMDTSKLTTIDLSQNQLAGGIPDDLVGVSGLQSLYLGENQFNGSIPNFAQNINYTADSQYLDFQNNSFSYVSLGLLTQATYQPHLVLRLSGNPQICPSSGGQYIPALEPLCSPVGSQVFQSQGNVDNLPSGGPIVIQYRLKSPGFSIFTYQYEANFVTYLANGLSVQPTLVRVQPSQVTVQSYQWQPGPRLFMIILINPLANTKFNSTEVNNIEYLMANWETRNSTVFGPYELIGFQYIGKGKSKWSKAMIVGVAVGVALGLLLVVLGIALVIALKKRRLTPAQRRRQKMLAMKASQHSMLKITGVSSFTYEELARATNNFSETHEVGHGGYGKVYRGVLESGQVVAIKRASLEAIQRNTEFYNEIELLSRCHHRNLVALVGYCHDEEEQMLVYEFMELGTLHDNLHAGAKVNLTFAMRLRIALGSAKGILYLHTEANPPIFHRDIKSNNILLDEKKQAKVADFGLSRLAPDVDLTNGETSSHVSTVVKGTPGYLDPEYFLTRKLTDKSDVYSFGVVLLELITGMQPISFGKNIVREVKASYDNGELLKVIDENMGSYPAEVMEPLAKLAISCVNSDTDARPTMQEVTRTLETLMMGTLGKDRPSMDISRDFSISQMTKEPSFRKDKATDGTKHVSFNDEGFDTGSSLNSQVRTVSSTFLSIQENDVLAPR